MKNKKYLLVLILIVLLVIGWIVTIKTMNKDDGSEQQAQLISRAEHFEEKEIYARAIEYYEKALTYDVGDHNAIEERLLQVYCKAEERTKYLNLAEDRISAQRAKEEEYKEVAINDINRGRLSEGLQLLQKGIDALGSQILKDCYEEYRYTYKVIDTVYEEIVPTASSTRMPALCDGNWYFINSKGKRVIGNHYEKVTPFDSDGKAAVSIDNIYYTITTDGELYSIDELGVTNVLGITDGMIVAEYDGNYSFYDYDFRAMAPSLQFDNITIYNSGLTAVLKNEKWNIISESGSMVINNNFEDVAINSLESVFCNNIAMLKENGKWYIYNSDGIKVSENGFFNAKAPESSGYIAVQDAAGLWGFIDTNGRLQIEYQYEDAFSFSNDVAAVKKDGLWGYINIENVNVIKSEYQEAKPFHTGVAIALRNQTQSIITLERYFK